jgi:hypothetical protein
MLVVALGDPSVPLPAGKVLPASLPGHCCIERSDIFSTANPSDNPRTSIGLPGSSNDLERPFARYALANGRV